MLSVEGEDICSTAMCCTCTGIAYVAEMEMPDAGGVAKSRKIAKP